ncbi:MAG: hydrogenase [Gemmatimonadetes bacterium GWC2_71_10]|nr:MAG: hydrogenase [Gemmatimonadetes bacterium GWC2_71_10]
MSPSGIVALGAVLALAPALPGVATRTRSLLTGRRGPPVLQLYFELAKLLRKRAVVSEATGAVFRAAPVVGLVGLVIAAGLLPLDGRTAIGGFAGDFLLFAGLLAVGRFAVMLAAFDTGSSFEGMGASREAMVGAFVEGALLLVFAALALATGGASLQTMLGPPLAGAWRAQWPALTMLGLAVFVLLLAEAARVPVDDPATHLELTMIHEVTILDHSGPDLALLLYGASLKFALLAALVAGVTVPLVPRSSALALLALLGQLVLVAVAVGGVEAAMARLRLTRIPQLLLAVTALVTFATILLLRRA